ncbi:MoaD/ThiS family protein [Candidatus Bathyarchaeota archaeon]|nr:MoaD/ThiS family protein [Candidatus Bathyarchaeota archaeon]
MRIRVRIFGEISEEIGKNYDFEIHGKITVLEVLEKVSSISGQKRGYLGNYKIGEKDIGYLVNGKNIEFLDGLATILHDDNELVILQPTTGG